MASAELEKLARIGQLKHEPPAADEVEGLKRSGEARALALAVLRRHGFRSGNRFLVFQTLPHTLGLPPATWRVPAECHETRNRAEYEGSFEIDERLVVDLIDAARAVQVALSAAGLEKIGNPDP